MRNERKKGHWFLYIIFFFKKNLIIIKRSDEKLLEVKNMIKK